jgi:hypothetical protein
MALLFFDGFEGLTGNTQLALRYDSVGASAFVTNSCVPTPPNGNAVSTTSTSSLVVVVEKFVTAHSSGVVGVRCLNSVVGTAALSGYLVSLVDEFGVGQLSIQFTSSGFLAVHRGAPGVSTLLGSASSGVGNQAWYYLEVIYTISDTVGVVTLKVNGTTILSLTSQDTRATGGSTNVASVRLQGNGNSITHYDDLYILDTTGSAPHNAALGPVRVLQVLPTAAGDSTQFTPSTGSNFQCVDEATHNGDTDYVESTTTGHIDTYNVADVTTTATVIYAVKASVIGRFATGGSRNIKLRIKSGSTTDVSAAKALTATYSELNHMVIVNPATTAAFTVSEVNSMLIGHEVA